MRTLFLCIWLVVLVILCMYIWRRWNGGKRSTKILGVGLVFLILWLCGSSLISVNTLSADVQKKIDKVVELYGDAYIQTDGSEIFLRVNEEWVNLRDISIIGGILADDLYIEYDGREIYLGHSGVVNVIKTLESFGLIG